MAFKYTPEKINYRRAFSSKQRQGIDVEAELKKLIQKELKSNLKKIIKDADFFGEKKDKAFNPFLSESKTNTSRGRAMDERQTQINIDQMVAEALMGGKFTTGILRNLFGLVPNLIGR